MIKIGETVGNKNTNEIFARKGEIISIQTSRQFYETGGLSGSVNAYGGVNIYDSRQINSSETRHILVKFEDNGEERTVFLTDHSIPMHIAQVISIGSVSGNNGKVYPHFVINHNENLFAFLPVNKKHLLSTKDNHLPFFILNSLVSYLGASEIFPTEKVLDMTFMLTFAGIFFALFFTANFFKSTINIDVVYEKALKEIISHYITSHNDKLNNFYPLNIKLGIVNYTSKTFKNVLKYGLYSVSFIFLMGLLDYAINSDEIITTADKIIKERKLKQSVSVPKELNKFIIAASDATATPMFSSIYNTGTNLTHYIDANRDGIAGLYEGITYELDPFDIVRIPKSIGSSIVLRYLLSEEDTVLLATGGQYSLKGNDLYEQFAKLYFKKNLKDLSPDEILFSYSLIYFGNLSHPSYSIRNIVDGMKKRPYYEKDICETYIDRREDYFNYLDMIPSENAPIHKKCTALMKV